MTRSTMSTLTPARPSLFSFWHDLPREGKLLLCLLLGLPRLVWTLCVLVAVFQSTGCERLRTSAGGAGFCGVPLLSRG
jgi:hypothetical protein